MPSIDKIEHLTPDQFNANKGTERGSASLENSLQKYGTGRSILIDKNGKIIAGNKTAEKAGLIGLDSVVVVPTDGTKLIAVQRIDLDLDKDIQARELAYADNRVSELDLEWDIDQMQLDAEKGIDFKDTGLWAKSEINKILDVDLELPDEFKIHEVINYSVENIKDHPRNYREHPDDQLDHIIESIKQHGLYRNIIISNDGTTLAGHGIMKAVRKMGIEEIPVTRLNINPESPQALKILTGDNEISRLAEINDRELSEILKGVKELDVEGLLGTGYDEMMLANLLMVTRPQSEINDINAASEWVGMPDFEPGDPVFTIIINCKSEELRQQFVDDHELQIIKREKKCWSTRYPWEDRYDLKSIRFEKND